MPNCGQLFLTSFVLILNEESLVKLVILGGVSNAGKSITIRYATKYLGIKPDISIKFIKKPFKNMRKDFTINNIPVYIFCSSPQEMSQGKVQKCRTIFKNRLKGKKTNSLVIMPFNLESKYEKATEACLKEIDNDLKENSYLIFLNAGVTNNGQAKSKFVELKKRGYLIIGEIQRIEHGEDEQGKMFADYVKEQLPTQILPQVIKPEIFIDSCT